MKTAQKAVFFISIYLYFDEVNISKKPTLWPAFHTTNKINQSNNNWSIKNLAIHIANH